jgi:hypothetical protein
MPRSRRAPLAALVASVERAARVALLAPVERAALVALLAAAALVVGCS